MNKFNKSFLINLSVLSFVLFISFIIIISIGKNIQSYSKKLKEYKNSSVEKEMIDSNLIKINDIIISKINELENLSRAILSNSDLKDLIKNEITNDSKIIEKDNIKIKEYRKAKLTDYSILLSKIKKEIFIKKDNFSEINFELVFDNKVMGRTSQLFNSYREKENSENIKKSYRDKKDFFNILSTKDGLVFKYFSYIKGKDNKSGILILSYMIESNFAENLKKLFNKEIIIYNKDKFFIGTLKNKFGVINFGDKENVFYSLNSQDFKKEVSTIFINQKENIFKIVYYPIKDNKNNNKGMIGIVKNEINSLDNQNNIKKLNSELVLIILVKIVLLLIVLTIYLLFYFLLYKKKIQRRVSKLYSIENIDENIVKNVNSIDILFDKFEEYLINSFEKNEVEEDNINSKAKRFDSELEKIKNINNELESRGTLKDDFIISSALEIKKPIENIQLISESLRENLREEINESMLKNIETVNLISKRIRNFIDDILDFSKLQKNDIELNFKAIDLYSTMDLIINTLRMEIDEKNFEIINKVDENQKLIKADEEKLKQILQNLLLFFIKNSESGKIVIESIPKDKFVEIIVKVEEQFLEINDVDNFFRPFFYSNSKKDDINTIIGLLLSVTKGLVELHLGRIWINDKNKFNEIHFTIDFYEEKNNKKNNNFDNLKNKTENIEKKQVEELIGNNFKNGYKILIVDDEKINQQVFMNYLLAENYNIKTADNGFEALEKIDSDNFDLILLDIMMPKMSGYNVLKKIREQYSLTELPVIILTAKNRTEEIVHGFACGTNDYLTKPFEKEELLSRISTLINLKYITKEVIETKLNLEKEKAENKINQRLNKINIALNSSLEIEKIIENLKIELMSIIKIKHISFYQKSSNKYLDISNRNNKRILSETSYEYKFFKECYDKNEILFFQLEKQKNEELNFYLFPIEYTKENYFVFVEVFNKKPIKNETRDLINSIFFHSLLAIKNSNLLNETNKSLLKLKTIMHITSLVFTEKDFERVKYYLLLLLLLTIKEEYKKVSYFNYHYDTSSLVLDLSIDKNNLPQDFSSKAVNFNINDFLDCLKESYKTFNNKKSYSRIMIENSRIYENCILNKEFIEIKNNEENEIFSGLDSERAYFFPIINEEKIMGFIVVESDFKERLLKVEEIIQIFSNELSVYINNKELRSKKFLNSKEKEFRCKKCNQKLSEYKGEIDFLEIKCPKCNTLNKIKK